MLQRIEHVAHVSVARACGFASLAILTFMVGLSADMLSSLKVGGILSLILCFTLLVKARLASRRSYKQTELWLMLPAHDRPHSAIAQQVIGTVLRETFLYFALHASFAAALLFGTALVYAQIFPAS
jgi:hypothetical protein